MEKITILLLFLTTSIFGQDSILLTKNFQFQDGIYLTLEELQSNQPTFGWDEVRASIFTNPQTMLTQVSSISLPDGGEDLVLDAHNIYALSIEGVPSIRVEAAQIQKNLATFAALKVRGKICYFGFPTIQKKQIAMQAYNPKNGRPFRSSTIERDQEVFREKMLHFETGEILPFEVANFLRWIQEDADLVKTISELKPAQQQEKLFKCLLIFDDRNHLYLVN
ncbi:MAG: hypothetical protein ACI9XO_000912 [Paraglaciecola sp.]|jgi:hypothetical protein